MRRIFGKPGFRGKAVLWAVMVTLVLLLGGCPQPDGGGGTTTYTVTFNANGGEPAPQSQAVNEGGKVAEPGAMTKANHAFGGWYKEAAFTTPWNFATDTVTADITLYAKWTPIPTYTVSGTIYTDNPGGVADGASVRLKRGGANAGSAVSTGADGAYAIADVPAGGGYTIEVSLSGYITGTISSFNVTGDVTGKDLTLNKLTPGTKTSYTGDGISFVMAWCPAA